MKKKLKNSEEIKMQNHVGVAWYATRKQNEGITLVALVITIIVLIILAGVSINAAINEGLIDNSKEAKTAYDEAKDKEEKELSQLVIEDTYMDFLSKGIPYMYKNGYITGVETDTTVGEMLAKFPQNEGYTIYESDEATSPMQDTKYVGTGKILKKGEGETKEIVGKIIIFGDVNGDGAVDGKDSIFIENAMLGASKNAGTGEDCFMVAGDVTGDGWIKLEDTDYIKKSTLMGNPKVNQNQIAKHPDDIILETETMRKRAEIDEIISKSTLPSNYAKVWNEDGPYYDVTVQNNEVDIQTLISYFAGQQIEVYKMNVAAEESEVVTSGKMETGYDYLVTKGETMCLYFTVR